MAGQPSHWASADILVWPVLIFPKVFWRSIFILVSSEKKTVRKRLNQLCLWLAVLLNNVGTENLMWNSAKVVNIELCRSSSKLRVFTYTCIHWGILFCNYIWQKQFRSRSDYSCLNILMTVSFVNCSCIGRQVLCLLNVCVGCIQALMVRLLPEMGR